MAGGWAYLAAFAATLVLVLVLTPLALRVAERRALFDRPGGYKVQEAAVPYLGGVAIVVAFASVVLAAAWLVPPGGGAGRELAAVLAAGVGLSLVGLVDDLRRGLPPFVRLSFQTAAAAAMWFVGIRVGVLDAAALDAVVTIVWIVGVTNAFNLLDNMDGLSAGVAAVAAGCFFVLAAVGGQVLVASLAIALAGCAVGFLRSNFHPARIYMGDAGSLFLGFTLAVLGLKLAAAGPAPTALLVPVLVLGVALFDTTLVTACRVLHGRSPLKGGRDHVSHRLVHLGLPVPVAVSAIYGVAGVLGLLAVVVSRVDTPTGLLVAGLTVGTALAGGAALGAVPVYGPDSRRRFLRRAVADREGGRVASPPVPRGLE